jgi:hypothetical protein
MSPDKRKEAEADQAARRHVKHPLDWSYKQALSSPSGDVKENDVNQGDEEKQQPDDHVDMNDHLDEDELPPAADWLQGKRIVCAECANCKMLRETNRQGCYIFKVRCAKKHWFRGKTEVTLDLHLASLRHRDSCPDYESTSDDEADRLRYIADLDEFLPNERHIHAPHGGFLDKTLTMKWGDGGDG